MLRPLRHHVKTSLKTQPQVFLSFALSDRQFAGEVAEQLQRSGLSVVRMSDLNAAGEYNDELRGALRRSAAVVVALPNLSARRDVPASVLFEIGAAVGAEKPIYVIVDRPSGRLPFGAPGLQVLPLNRLDEIARKIDKIWIDDSPVAPQSTRNSHQRYFVAVAVNAAGNPFTVTGRDLTGHATG